jgi:hypothetical protein
MGFMIRQRLEEVDFTHIFGEQRRGVRSKFEEPVVIGEGAMLPD